ncbi:BTB/POZ domain protein [Beauveria brongniartii RCEF 3172]|uniref:BTB/POZ domain protein n=1 Tax=Beauveria brongniartii RCEF 3172 TaxID=1081107 RepID=A0A167A9P0_9HYPO|nr:BTB/POZ domain protein [Beauveria brongniartii RCEF 3172]
MADSTRGPNLGHLLKSGQFSDLTLVCSDKEFNVHKAVVCAQSKVVAAAIREPFQESKTGKIVIEEYDTDTVENMVEFLYTGDYKPKPPQAEKTSDDTASEKDLVQHMLVTSIADSFEPEPHQAEETIDDATPEGILVQHMLMDSIADYYKPQPHQVEETSENAAPEEDLVQHVLVNSIADYYDIPALADLSKEKLRHASQDANSKSHLLEAATVALSRTGDATVHAMLAEATAKNIRHHLEGVAAEDELRSEVQRLKDKLAAAEYESIYDKAGRKEAEDRETRILEKFKECRDMLAQRVWPTLRALVSTSLFSM